MHHTTSFTRCNLLLLAALVACARDDDDDGAASSATTQADSTEEGGESDDDGHGDSTGETVEWTCNTPPDHCAAYGATVQACLPEIPEGEILLIIDDCTCETTDPTMSVACRDALGTYYGCLAGVDCEVYQSDADPPCDDDAVFAACPDFGEEEE